MVRNAANSILAQNHTTLHNNDELPPQVGIHWLQRYLDKSLYKRTKAKPMETARKKAQEPAYIKGWFNDFLVYYQEYGIVPADF